MALPEDGANERRNAQSVNQTAWLGVWKMVH